jgi:hypothetical protein
MRTRLLVSILAGLFAVGCANITLEASEVCSESDLVFAQNMSLPPEAAQLLANTPDLQATATAWSSLDFSDMRNKAESEAQFALVLNDAALRFDPEQFAGVNGLDAWIELEEQPGTSVPLLHVEFDEAKRKAGQVLVDDAAQRAKLVEYLRAGKTKITYAVSGTIPEGGLTVKNRTCVSTSAGMNFSAF